MVRIVSYDRQIESVDWVHIHFLCLSEVLNIATDIQDPNLCASRHTLRTLVLGNDIQTTLVAITDAVEGLRPGFRAMVVWGGVDSQPICLGSDTALCLYNAMAGAQGGAVRAAWNKLLDSDTVLLVPNIYPTETYDFRALRDALEHYHVQSCCVIPMTTKDNQRFGSFVVFNENGPISLNYRIEALQRHAYMAELAIEKHRREHESKLLAQQDALTGMLNRRTFFEVFDILLDEARRKDACLSVLLIDLDRFKEVNDSWGHSVGDKVIQVISRRLVDLAKETDLLARLGGDEFVVILPDTDVAAANHRAEQILERIKEPFDLESAHRFRVTASLGTSTFPTDGTDVNSLLINADAAMYFAKSLGRNRRESSRPQIRQSFIDRQIVSREIDAALENGEFRLFYQPQVDANGCLRSCEALIRWDHPKRGFLLPSAFIPIAESTGKIVEIGEWVIREVCRQVREWLDDNQSPVRVAINISPSQFGHRLPEVLRRHLDEYELGPEWIEIEITETLLFEHEHTALFVLTDMKALGLQITLDDFGTGYSSFGFLRKFPVDAVKIDRSFVNDCETSSGRSIVSAMLSMCQHLGLPVVVEGVETKAQHDFLVKEGSALLQGYLYSKPLDAKTYTQVIAKKGGVTSALVSTLGTA